MKFDHEASFERTTMLTEVFPMLEPKYVVLTKPGLVHPHKAHKSVAAFILKRMVCTKAEPMTCHSYKVGICLKCNNVMFERVSTQLAWPKDLEAKKDSCSKVSE